MEWVAVASPAGAFQLGPPHWPHWHASPGWGWSLYLVCGAGTLCVSACNVSALQLFLPPVRRKDSHSREKPWLEAGSAGRWAHTRSGLLEPVSPPT